MNTGPDVRPAVRLPLSKVWLGSIAVLSGAGGCCGIVFAIPAMIAFCVLAGWHRRHDHVSPIGPVQPEP